MKFCKLAFLVYNVTPKPLSMNCILLMPPQSSAGSYFIYIIKICWQNGNDKNRVWSMLSSSQKPRCWKHVVVKQCRATTHAVGRREEACWLMGFFFSSVVLRQHISLIPYTLHFWMIAWLTHKISLIHIINICPFVDFLLG